jgi:transposase InsO family protein
MDYHKNARLTVSLRAELAERVVFEGVTLKLAAASFNVSAKTAAKWVGRYREHGPQGLPDRSSRPRSSPRRTPSLLLERVLSLRRLRYNGWRIAREVGVSRATVSRILRRNGMNRLRSLDPPPPVVRYEHAHPGDLIHFDIKRLARIVKPGHRIHGDRTQETRGAGYEYLHIATPPQRAQIALWGPRIDDHSRIAFGAILPDQTHRSAINFFLMARAHYARFGFSIRRVLTDNGACYKDGIFRMTLRQQHIKHRFTRPYTPRTNGKAERFIQTTLREWAYARSYQNSAEREQNLDPWLHDYNFHRPHASLNLNTPASRSGLNRNNLLSLHN